MMLGIHHFVWVLSMSMSWSLQLRCYRGITAVIIVAVIVRIPCTLHHTPHSVRCVHSARLPFGFNRAACEPICAALLTKASSRARRIDVSERWPRSRSVLARFGCRFGAWDAGSCAAAAIDRRTGRLLCPKIAPDGFRSVDLHGARANSSISS